MENLTKKKVCFNNEISVYYISHDFEIQQYRKAFWELYARDRMHFKRRILEFEKIFKPLILLK